jgi:iron complex outermembrane receptor protein
MVWLALVAASPLAADAPAGKVELDPIAVTGTRLRNENAEGAFPVSVFDREAIVNSGQTSLGDFLQELPFLSGSPLNTSTSARGEGGGMSRGISTVELRGLGPERTLVLLNGRRIVPGGNGASGMVDVSMIPLAMVERVEVFKSGASVEYGADAVAGVINIITRRDADGLELGALGSITSEGDAERYVVSASFGQGNEHGHFLFGAEYSDQPALGKGERDWSYNAVSVTGPQNEVIPFGSSAPPLGNHGTSGGRVILREGAPGTAVADFRRFTAADRYNFNPAEDLLQASERLSLFAQGRFEVTPVFSLSGEALYQQRDSSAMLASLPFFTNREIDVAVSADNVYNPFRERITDARRRLVEAGPRSFIQDNEAWRFVLGADGTLAETWVWDASVNVGRNETGQVQTGDLFDSQLRLALGPSFFDATGKAVCGTPAAPIAGCVPLNLFGPVGSITPEMLDFVGTDLHDTGYNDQKVFSTNISGNPWTLPAGEVGLAFGYEYRDESAADVPDPETVAGNTTGSARGITRGDFQSHEAYAEMGIPLLTDAAMARDLSLDLGARWVNFSNFETEWVSEIGLRYQPLADWQFRLSYTEAFRAPNVIELYGGVRQSNPVVEDPCADFSQLGPEEIDRCVAQGVPADGSFDQNGQETPVVGGGNPGLGPELADTYNFGVTWVPGSLPGLRISLDYFSVDIDNGIAALSANSILEQCVEAGIAEYCDRITRNDEGGITKVTAELQNLSAESTKGIDLDAQLAHAGLGGDFGHRLLLSYLGERDIIAFEGAEPFGSAGEYVMGTIGAIPRWRGQYSLEWGRGSWRLGYQAQWIGSMEEQGGELYPGTVNNIPGRIYQDVYAGYDFTEMLTVTGGVDNISNEDPPFFVNADEANTDVSTYRLYGTTFWLRVNLHY